MFEFRGFKPRDLPAPTWSNEPFSGFLMGDDAGYAFRFLTDRDESLVWRMLYEAARVAEEQRRSVDDIRQDFYLQKYAKGWGRSGDLGIAAFTNGTGEPVGAAWLRVLVGADRGDGYIDDETPELAVGVIPGHRGRGVGTELLQRLLEAARGLIPAVSLTVRDSSPSIRLYERFGFRRLPGKLTNRVGGRSVKMVLTWR
jgi:ribosomal protein S18 acetylase RimI-like enzyme